jgi:DNA mismatch repair protein MutH
MRAALGGPTSQTLASQTLASQTPITPHTLDELMARARALAGYNLRELAAQHGVALPSEPLRAKGYIGQLVERTLGANGRNRDISDFPDLGVELKTLPVDAKGRPRESTFVCVLDLARVADLEWERSRVKRKLERVLFLPIESGPKLAFGDRRVGSALLWSPSEAQDHVLRADFEEIAGRIAQGQVDSIRGTVGQALQLRPKAAHSRIRTRVLDADGAPARSLPRGFYLRASFTHALLRAGLRLE